MAQAGQKKFTKKTSVTIATQSSRKQKVTAKTVNMDIKPKQYLNPLTLEAHFFLSAMQNMGKNSVEIDPILCQTLEEIADAIDKFVNKELQDVVPTENLHLIGTNEILKIRRTLECSECKRQLGSTIKACNHLIQGHDKQVAGERSDTNKANSKSRTRKAENRTKVLPPRTKSLLISDLNKFHVENWLIAEKLKQIPEYQIIENHLNALITPMFPDKKVNIYKFGSRIAGIATRNSDLDIFVDVGNTFQIFENRASMEVLLILRLVYAGLKKAKEWAKPQAIENARVPIIKTRHLSTGIECDIGFSNSLGYCNTQLMQYIFQLQPLARRTCIFMKRWLDRSKFHDITTYTIALMVIFFLQTQRQLPAIYELQSESNGSNIGPWKVDFFKKTLADFKMTELKENWCQLQTNFFEFYSKFDYDKNIICPLLGRITNAKCLNNVMPKRYNQWINSKNPGLEITSIVVQDPLQLNHNVAKNISAEKLKLLTAYFEMSAKQLVEQL